MAILEVRLTLRSRGVTLGLPFEVRHAFHLGWGVTSLHRYSTEV